MFLVLSCCIFFVWTFGALTHVALQELQRSFAQLKVAWQNGDEMARSKLEVDFFADPSPLAAALCLNMSCSITLSVWMSFVLSQSMLSLIRAGSTATTCAATGKPRGSKGVVHKPTRMSPCLLHRNHTPLLIGRNGRKRSTVGVLKLLPPSSDRNVCPCE